MKTERRYCSCGWKTFPASPTVQKIFGFMSPKLSTITAVATIAKPVFKESGFFVRQFEIVKFHIDGWQEPCESRGTCSDLWGRGSEIPLRSSTIKCTTKLTLRYVVK